VNAIDYAVNRDVRNTTIVREVDRTRQRELWRWVLFSLLLVGTGLFCAWQHFQFLQQGYLVTRTQTLRAAEEETTRQLKLEIETLRAPQRIEKLATERLRMVAPQAGQVIVLERVVPSEPPPSSIVATR
jgi:cell division protein FtsL